MKPCRRYGGRVSESPPYYSQENTMATKKPVGDPATKTYRVLTPLRIDEKTKFGEGEKIEMLDTEAAELVAAGALVEVET